MKTKFYLSWITTIVAAFFFMIMSYDFFQDHKWITSLLFFILAIVMIIVNLQYILKSSREAEQILGAITNQDFSLFPNKKQENRLKQQAVNLYYKEKEANTNFLSFKVLYENILNQLDIGIMILSSSDAGWQVFYSNPKFIEILKIPKYNSWDYYEEKIPEFYQLIAATSYQESQDFMEISINNGNLQTYSLRTTRVDTPKENYCIITLESVQKIVERKEKMAWNNLMKVISHELLNTLTPINSLITNMEYIADQEEVTAEDQEEMRDSLKIINNKSEQLLSFVNSYRQVAELPKPRLERILLQPIFDKAVRLMSSEFQNKGITLEVEKTDLSIMADEKMIERSLINLLTNAMHAVEDTENKKVSIYAELLNKRVVIRVNDNGVGISDQIADKIFMPFYTTRSSGSGIGLTLTKSIMEAHNGYINYRKLTPGSSFELWFT